MRAAVLAVALAACKYEGEFPCTQTEECRTADNAGNCEREGWCSVHDDTCDSGRRFDETAGDGLARQCVAGPEGCEAWMPHYFRPCGLPPPSGNLSLNGFYLFNTTEGTLTELATMTTIPQPSTVIDGVRYLSVQDVTMTSASQLRLVGQLPIVIAAWGSMMINGTIDAGSHSGGGGGGNGPGHDPTECASNRPGDGMDASDVGGGGGGGGGALGKGGDGGLGAKGGAKVVAVPQTIRGGCTGGRSGNAGAQAVAPAMADTNASGGKGGGALVLSARLSMTIDGDIASSGEGGAGSPMGARCGGGGGGSGGLIAIESPTVSVHGTVVAAGGGGGGVAPTTAAGQKGRDGALLGAAGGIPVTGCSGTGGAGSTSPSDDGGQGGTGTCGGAGGGGAAGWVLVFAQNFDQVGAMFVPAPKQNPF